MELNIGILKPLQTAGKTRGPPENLRPIMLLSVLRKILTICMISRTWDRLKQRIPIDQSAYQPGRSTTEQVFAIKMLVEKAILASDYALYLLLLDMSKAFDTVDREILFEELEQTLQEVELHILSKITNTPEIKVRVGQTIRESFTSTIGKENVPVGYILFTTSLHL